MKIACVKRPMPFGGRSFWPPARSGPTTSAGAAATRLFKRTTAEAAQPSDGRISAPWMQIFQGPGSRCVVDQVGRGQPGREGGEGQTTASDALARQAFAGPVPVISLNASSVRTPGAPAAPQVPTQRAGGPHSIRSAGYVMGVDLGRGCGAASSRRGFGTASARRAGRDHVSCRGPAGGRLLRFAWRRAAAPARTRSPRTRNRCS